MAQRGRKKGSDGEASRALLLKIAADQFAENGYYQTKISDIVKKANVTQPTFYLYFKSKEAIFTELENLFQKELSALTVDIRFAEETRTDELPHRLTYNLRAVFCFFSTNRSLARIGFYLSPKSRNIKTRMAAEIENQFMKEAKKGGLHLSIDLNTVAFGLVGMIEQLTVSKLWTGEKTPEELADEVAKMILEGIRKK